MNNKTPIILLPATFEESSVIKDISIEINFVEFEDYSVIKVNESGAKLIEEFRKGVSKYKDRLAKKLAETKDEEKILKEFSQGSPSVADENLNDFTQKELDGVKIFKQYLRKIYSTEGLYGVKEFLKLSKEKKNEN